MSEELQTTEALETIVQDDVVENTEVGTGETGSELAADSGEAHEQINQEKVNQAINKQHAKFREEERKRKEAEAENQKLLEQLKSIEANKPKPVVPPIPDPYDDDYEAKVKERDDALLAKAKHDAIEASKAEAEKERQQKALEAQQAETQKHINSYEKRSVEIGLDSNEVNKAGQVLVDYGINSDLAMFILQDKDGPLITQHLAANPAELSELLEMSPMMAAVTINSVVRPKAEALKPKPSKAPDPVKGLSGLGPGETVPASIKGAKFE